MEIKVKITFLEELLGTSPADSDIYKTYIGKNAPDAPSLEEEIEAVGVDGVTEKGMTIFPKDENGIPFLWDYQIKGFFKDSCGMLSRISGGKDEKGKKIPQNESGKITAFKKVIDGLIFVNPRKIPLNVNGEIGICQRPLRTTGPQGERVALSISEAIPAGTTAEFTIVCMDGSHEDAVVEWLNYGILRGIGQWRNSGKGRFTWEGK